MSNIRVKIKGTVPEPTVTGTGRMEASPPAVEPAPAAPMPRQEVGFSHEEAAVMVREGLAQMSQHDYPTPMPDGFQATVDANAAANATLSERMLSVTDGALEEVAVTAVASVRRAATPFLTRFADLKEAFGKGELTPKGYQARVHALKTEMNTALEEQAFGPQEQKLAATELRYKQYARVTPPNDAQRLEATTIAAELPHLAPKHALPRVAEVLQKGIRADNFGVVRALLPYLKTRLEEPGTSYYGNQDVFAMVRAMESSLSDWHHTVGTARLQQVQAFRYELYRLKEMTEEGLGDVTKGFGFPSMLRLLRT